MQSIKQKFKKDNIKYSFGKLQNSEISMKQITHSHHSSSGQH